MYFGVSIAFFSGTLRKAKFAIEVHDGKEWKKVFSGESSGKTEDLIEDILRDRHRKRNERFKTTHSFVNKRYLLALGREKRELLAGGRLRVQL